MLSLHVCIGRFLLLSFAAYALLIISVFRFVLGLSNTLDEFIALV